MAEFAGAPENFTEAKLHVGWDSLCAQYVWKEPAAEPFLGADCRSGMTLVLPTQKSAATEFTPF